MSGEVQEQGVDAWRSPGAGPRADVQGCSSAALIEVSDRLTLYPHSARQVEGEVAAVCSLVYKYGLLRIHESVTLMNQSCNSKIVF